ncbi:transcription factor che-1-like [Dermacentor albipictus]|uniref:transcription factor che-1-like n=1 Tax=Dermacentor albipictus TaxID=60249 RepID=UPI0038FC19E4
MPPSHAMGLDQQLPRQPFEHLPLRKRILLRVQQNPDLAREYGLGDSCPAVVAAVETNQRRTCLVCHKRFASARKYRSHELRHRSKMLGRYRCDKCSKCFVQKSSLVTHARIHTGERPYRCRHCNASFGDVSCYNKHMRVHSGERPYVCIACNKGFTQSGNLYRHMRSCAQLGNKSPSPS